AGTIKADSDYYPWGGELQFVNNDSNHFKYIGMKRDDERKLDCCAARVYVNELVRLRSPDLFPKSGRPTELRLATDTPTFRITLWGLHTAEVSSTTGLSVRRPRLKH